MDSGRSSRCCSCPTWAPSSVHRHRGGPRSPWAGSSSVGSSCYGRGGVIDIERDAALPDNTLSDTTLSDTTLSDTALPATPHSTTHHPATLHPTTHHPASLHPNWSSTSSTRSISSTVL